MLNCPHEACVQRGILCSNIKKKKKKKKNLFENYPRELCLGLTCEKFKDIPQK